MRVTFQMSPISQFKLDAEVNLPMAGNSNKMMDSEDSFVSASTDVAAVSPEMQPIITPETKTPNEEKPEEVEAEVDGSGENEVDDGFGEFLSLVKNNDCDGPAVAAEGEDDDGNTANDQDKEVVSHGDMYIGLVDTSPPTQEDAAVAPTTVDVNADDTPSSSKSNTMDGEAPDLSGPSAPATEEGAVAEGEKNESLNDEELKVDPSVTRRSSNAKKIELHSQNLLNSVTSVDSWGGKSGSLSPLSIPHTNTMPEFATTSATLLAKKESNVSSLDDDNSIKSDPTGSSPSPQDKAPEPVVATPRSQSWSPGPPLKQGAQDLDGEDEVDQVANYVNFNQLLQPSSSSEYYYSQANRSNRHMLDKLNSKKNRGVSIDESHHSRSSVLSERSRASSYRGPTPMMRDGSIVKSLIKTRALSTTSERRRMSVDSLMSQEVSPEEDSESKTGSIKRCIFSCVDIREHERIAGDNPCVTSGVPLSIGWGYYQHDSITLDDYELNKGTARDKIEMMVPAGVRRQMLRDEFGVTITEMNAAMKQVNITKRQRRHTVGMEHLEGWQEVGQSAKRKVKRFVKGTSTAKEEEKMWTQARQGAMKEYLKTHGEAKNPESPGVGIINNGSKIAPENGQAAPFLEISFQKGEGEGGAPSF